MPAVLPAVGVLTLLVNLLAAGGIGFPGVAGSLWLLLAVGLNTAGADQPPRTLPRISAVAVLVVALALAVACYASAYGPVLRCQAELRPVQEAWAEGNLAAAEKHLLAAAKADPLAADPRHQLLAVASKRWREKKTPETLRQLDRYLDRYDQVLAELAPNSSRAWLAAGELHEEVYSATGRRGDVDRAIEAYSRAVALYPNSGLCRARLALAHQAAGDLRNFRDQADWALRLDQQTPHADKKLPPELRRRLVPRTRLVPEERPD
jgi:tetratricopeptide (TPR) repeat protein